MNIVFLDPKCPTPYDSEVLRTKALGGTEASVIRVAQGLSRSHSVRVLQHNRTEALEEHPGLHFLPMASMPQAVQDADHVIFIQKAQHIEVAAKGPARLWLWLHNYLKDEVPFFWQDHLRYRLGIVCVSKAHADHTRRHLHSLPGYWASLGSMGRGGLLYQHNPIDSNLGPDPHTSRDRHKLVFFSSPYKGLEQVVPLFRQAHARDRRLKLYVADPGYIKNVDPNLLDAPGIVRLGALPHRVALQHVREALCVFYPQRKRPETFGLVYAEANAVGTPVLAHRFGSAQEVLCKSNPPLDASNGEAVIGTLLDWVERGAPKVQANPLFDCAHVVNEWSRFLAAPARFVSEQEHAGKTLA
ncbi:MAG: glycosyl transferase group 1 [Rhodoferax sp.]|nr:glycosyl transferase group 1 [Rhodoferax sp.]